MPNEQPKVQPETTAITSGRDSSGSLAPTLWPSTTWHSAGLDDSTKHALSTHKSGNYARYSNPTVRSFEEAVAELEGAEDALEGGAAAEGPARPRGASGAAGGGPGGEERKEERSGIELEHQ